MYLMTGGHDMCMEGDLRFIDKIVVHPGYQHTTGPNDIALIRVTEDIKFDAKTGPICLPEKKATPGQSVISTGWGTTAKYNPGQKMPDSPFQCGLKETTVKVLADSEPNCQASSGGDTTTMMCAWAAGTGSCQGDSGGPLFSVEGGKFVQVGAVSFGAGCGGDTTESTGIYARLSHFTKWISGVIKDGDC